jgi:hypothetical protein
MLMSLLPVIVIQRIKSSYQYINNPTTIYTSNMQGLVLSLYTLKEHRQKTPHYDSVAFGVQASRDASMLPVSFGGKTIDQGLADALLEEQPHVLEAFKYAHASCMSYSSDVE